MSATQVIIIGQLPPPVHGQSVAIERIVGIEDEDFEITALPMNCSASIENVGSFQIRKIFVMLEVAFRLLGKCFGRGDVVVYYPPASPERVPILRDMLFFTIARIGVRRWVFHFHAGGLPEFLSKSATGRFAKAFFPRPKACISMSRDSSPSPGAFFGGEDFYIPYGMDIPLPFETGERRSPKRMLFVGNLFISKGVEMCLRALRQLLDEGHPVGLDFVGGHVDRDRARVLKLVDELGLGESVHFHGVLTGDAKWERFREADCFVFPSHYPAEKFPNVLIEALGSGLPVVTTRWRGIPELMGGSVEGSMLIEPGDQAAFEAGIKRILLADPIDYARFRRASRARYESRYTLEKFKRGILGAFHFASKNQPKRQPITESIL